MRTGEAWLRIGDAIVGTVRHEVLWRHDNGQTEDLCAHRGCPKPQYERKQVRQLLIPFVALRHDYTRRERVEDVLK